jgi:hypothetical protein
MKGYIQEAIPLLFPQATARPNTTGKAGDTMAVQSAGELIFRWGAAVLLIDTQAVDT